MRTYRSRVAGLDETLQTAPKSREPLAHADSLFDGVAEGPVELENLDVRFSNLQIQLRAAQAEEPGFCFSHHRPAEAVASIRWADCEMVDPAAEAIESCKEGGNHASLMFAHKKELALNLELASHHGDGFVPRRIIGERLAPKRYNIRFIRFAERADQKLGR